jgi:hypothetical protein
MSCIWILPAGRAIAPGKLDFKFTVLEPARNFFERLKHNRSVMVSVQGPDYYDPPLSIHSFIEWLNNYWLLKNKWAPRR